MNATLLSLFAFLSVMSVFAGIFILLRALFHKRLTTEQMREKQAATAEAEAISRLTRQRASGGFDKWFSTVLEEGGSSLSPLTASMLAAGFTLLVGGSLFVLTDNVLLGAGAGMIAVVLPFVYWNARRQWRISKMRKQLPEALESMGDAIRCGLNLELAMEGVIPQLEEPLKAEFQYGVKQLAVGLSVNVVMEYMARRIPVPEFRIFTTAIIVHRRTGGNLALLAERLAKSARERTEFYSMVRAVSAGSRFSMIGLIVVTFVAIIFLAGLNKDYIYGFVGNPYGPYLIGTAVSLIFIGSLWAWKIMKIPF